jgi:hypothetical protein
LFVAAGREVHIDAPAKNALVGGFDFAVANERELCGPLRRGLDGGKG